MGRKSDRFTEMQMLQLVQMYRDHECLWNVISPLYKNRNARESAYKEIWQNLNIPGLLLKDVPKKIKNLRCSYCQEQRKIENSIHSGASQESVYKPKVSWFTIADGFLRTCRSTTNILSNIDEYSITDMPTSENDSETSHMEGISNRNVEEIFNFHNDNETSTSQVQEEQSTTSKTQFIISPREPVKKFKSRSKNDDNEDIYEAIKKIDKISEKLNSRNKEDEFDIFGKYIAMTLRSLPPETSVTAKLELQKTISEIQLKVMRQANGSIQSPSGASS